MKKLIIGVMGPGENATPSDLETARELGKLIAQQGWVLLTGGRNSGVMDAASIGAKSANGLTIGILPSSDTSNVSDAVDIAIITDMGNARNNINVLSSDVVIACGMGAGTASEIALAIKANKPVILLNCEEKSREFFGNLGGDGGVAIAPTPQAAIQQAKQAIALIRQLSD
ncbi:MAG TPA: TIGR00725 family protein [Cyanobacteria bacterium UBA11369]|nr:TIGR00725 family protein [Cyanobacteria bacterium UBA11371]HBE31183.1 TIGR00725 family protein [Cyanobacteria bacterium UBA11368]HBE51972.1 TIGR00725 family protein [Cyanobacteria bacterium UBA11369]